MKIRMSPRMEIKLKSIQKKDKKLFIKIEKQITIFSKNPKHHSLRIHKLSGKMKNIWSISITKSIRAVYILEKDEAYFYKIGTHDQVYKK